MGVSLCFGRIGSLSMKGCNTSCRSASCRATVSLDSLECDAKLAGLLSRTYCRPTEMIILRYSQVARPLRRHAAPLPELLRHVATSPAHHKRTLLSGPSAVVPCCPGLCIPTLLVLLLDFEAHAYEPGRFRLKR